MRSLVIVCTLCSLAHAEPTQEVVELTTTARTLARHRDCDSIQDLATRVRRLDVAYYRAEFAVDPDIANCELSVDTSDRDGGPAVHKDRTTAIVLSWIPTLAGAGIAAAGLGLTFSNPDDTVGEAMAMVGSTAMFIGPSLGHGYAGKLWTPWLGVRLASSVLSTIVAAVTIAADHDYGLELQPRTEKILIPTAIVGGTGYLVGVIGDLVTAGSAVDDYNSHHLQLTVAPVATRTGITPGIGLAGSF
jgi:hypothetical protein